MCMKETGSYEGLKANREKRACSKQGAETSDTAQEYRLELNLQFSTPR